MYFNATRTDRVPGVIYPTNRCFDDAVEIAMKLVANFPVHGMIRRIRIVHGLLTMPMDGTVFAHAWVLLDRDKVIQRGIQDDRVIEYALTITEFRDLYNPDKCIQYSLKEIRGLIQRNKNCGPFNRRFWDHVNWNGGKPE